MKIRQLARYGAVSLISTAVSMMVLGVLVATGTVAPTWANVIATAVGTVPSFELNRRWVWGRTGRRSLVAEIGPFCVMSFAGLALSTVAVGAAASWAAAAGVGNFVRTVAVEGANVAAFGSLWVAQFLILDRLMFGPAARWAPRPGSGAEPVGVPPIPPPRAASRPAPRPVPCGPTVRAT
jgi:putative flippase GtrA